MEWEDACTLLLTVLEDAQVSLASADEEDKAIDSLYRFLRALPERTQHEIRLESKRFVYTPNRFLPLYGPKRPIS